MEGRGFTDPYLGSVAWDADDEWWTFDAGPVDGRPLPGVLPGLPSPLSPDFLEHARGVVRWVRANEPGFRRTVALGMIDWVGRKYGREPGKDEEDTLEKVEPFLRIARVEVYGANRARIDYDPTSHLARMCLSSWGSGVSVAVDGSGALVGGPEATSWFLYPPDTREAG